MDVICNFWDVHVIYIFVAISLMYDINIVYMYSFFFQQFMSTDEGEDDLET